MAVHKDGKFALSCSRDSSVILWDLLTNSEYLRGRDKDKDRGTATEREREREREGGERGHGELLG